MSIQRRKIRWLIAHFPIELFVRTAKAFAIELEKLCPKQFEIEILTVGDYVEKYQGLYNEEELKFWRLTTPSIPGLENSYRTIKPTDVTETETFLGIKDRWNVFFNALRDGNFEMSQTQVSIVGSHLDSNFHAIDLPYLFNDHDHVSRALDGEVGSKLCEKLGDRTGVRGLSFTYSGGYRIIGSTDGITSLNELNNKKFITATATSDILFNQAGIDHVGRHKTTVNDIGDMSNEGGAIETTYLRFEGKNILKTNHSMFMTSVLTSDKFLASLTEEQREAFKTAAKRVAKIERTWSVEDAAKYEAEAEARGIKIVDINDEEQKLLRTSAQKVYQKETLEKIGIDYDIVNEIIAMGTSRSI